MGLSNVENILEQALAGEPITIKPESRVEALLIALIETGGGGGGGTTDYTQLSNKPQIAGTTLTGNKTLNELGIASKADMLKRMQPVLSMPSAITDGLVIFWCGQPTTTFKTGGAYIYDGTGQQWLTMYEPAEIPENTSDLINDSGFITNTVNNLANYYLKSQTYTQAEVDALIAAAKNGRFISVDTLPTTDIDTKAIYLVPSEDPEAGNVKDEYINLDGTSAGWEFIGSTAIDLSGYVTDAELTTALADYTTTAILNSLLAGKVDNVAGKGLSENDYTDADKAIVGGVTSALASKQDTISDLATIRSGAGAGATAVQPSATEGLLKNDGTVDTVAKASQAAVNAILNGTNIDSFGDVETALADKVDKVVDKGLSTNDYTDADKAIVEGMTSALAGKVDKVTGKGLSENDYTTAEKTKLEGLSNYDDTALTGRVTAAETAIAGKASAEDVSALTEDYFNRNGMKNLIQLTESSQTYTGITNTIDKEAGTVTVSGTNTGSSAAFKVVAIYPAGYFKPGKYIFSGHPGGTGETLALRFRYISDGNKTLANILDNSEVEVTITPEIAACPTNVMTSVAKDTTIDNVVLKPMLRYASNSDSTFEPYVKTNKELTDDLADQVAKEAAFETAQAAETEAAWDGINRIMLPGRDLTVIFADEIANYSDEWAWIQARLNAHNVSGLRVGDYIPIKVGAENHLAEIAGINTYRRTGDSGHEVGYHIDWITRDCYSQTVQFNTTNNNNGNANSPSPFLASNLKSWLDGTLYPLLDAKLKAVIKAKRILAPYRYQSGATLTDDNSWAWQDFDKLWVPLETEIFDCLVWSTKGFGNGQAAQYPIFANSYEHRMKGAGPGGGRAYWWTASATSGDSTSVVLVHEYGLSNNYPYASTALRVPVCFRTMEA